MPGNLHRDPSRDAGSDEIPDPAAAKVVNQQALVLPNFRACLHSQSYLNAGGLKSLAQVPSVEHLPLPGQAAELFSQLNRKGKENWLFILRLPSLQTKQHASILKLDL